MLFGDQKTLAVQLPARDSTGQPATVGSLIGHLAATAMTDGRRDLFVLEDGAAVHLRPGILVLINDADWELEGEEAYVLQRRDTVLFVSTLHGG